MPMRCVLLAVPAALAAPALDSCTTKADSDLQGNGVKQVAAADAGACCTACTAVPECAAATFVGGQCYMKDSQVTWGNAGHTVVIPAGRSPPTPPPATPAPPTPPPACSDIYPPGSDPGTTCAGTFAHWPELCNQSWIRWATYPAHAGGYLGPWCCATCWGCSDECLHSTFFEGAYSDPQCTQPTVPGSHGEQERTDFCNGVPPYPGSERITFNDTHVTRTAYKGVNACPPDVQPDCPQCASNATAVSVTGTFPRGKQHCTLKEGSTGIYHYFDVLAADEGGN